MSNVTGNDITLRARASLHREYRGPGISTRGSCTECGESWPCLVDALTTENARLEEAWDEKAAMRLSLFAEIDALKEKIAKVPHLFRDRFSGPVVCLKGTYVWHKPSECSSLGGRCAFEETR